MGGYRLFEIFIPFALDRGVLFPDPDIPRPVKIDF
jgi:hypothetical protein